MITFYYDTVPGIISSSNGRAMWPEEELEDLVCDIICATVTVILRV
jgi:hypothetical protein